MLFVGRQRERTCQTLTRRAFLQAGASTVLGLSLADMLRLQAMGGAPMAGSARSVLLLWLWGGPAHLHTWDPQPGAAHLCPPSWSLAVGCIRGRNRLRARVAAPSAVCSTPFALNMTRKSGPKCLLCNCPPTSPPNGSRTDNSSRMPSTSFRRTPIASTVLG